MKKRTLALLACALLAMGLLAGCGGGAGAASVASSTSQEVVSIPQAYATSLQDILDKGKLIIGLDDTFAPMGFRETDGTLVGFDIDLATAVCEELGVTAEFQPIDWNAKEMELSTGKIDCIWNGMSATPEREATMSLTQPYLNNKIIVMTAPGVAIESKEDLVNYNIGVQAASAALEALMADPVYESVKDKVTEYPTYDEVLLDMNTGRIDCVVIDQVFGDYKNAQLDESLGTAPFDFGDDLFVVGFRRDDVELTNAVNDALNKLIENGKAAEISAKWFGSDIVIGSGVQAPAAADGTDGGSSAAPAADSSAPDASSVSQAA